MDYNTLIDLAVKVEQQVKEEASKVYQPLNMSYIIRNQRKIAKMEVLNLIYDLAQEAKNND